jgi:diacylglycerol O-acyltransferase / wax synthase
MRRLNAIDTTLLYQDTLLDNYGHSMRVIVVDTSRCPEDLAYQHVREGLESLCSRLAPFSWRQVATPLGLHRPMWVKDPDFVMDNHFYRIGCPPPGADAELADLVAMIASRPLDLSSPLWENWIVEGLASGHIAVISKVHHALVDGVGTVQMYEELCTTEPVPHGDLPSPPQVKAAPIPSKAALLALAAKDVFALLPAVPVVLRRAREVRRARLARAPELAPAQPHTARPTSLNGKLGPHRRYAFVSFAIADIKTIKDTFNVSVNHVYLAVCAGALQCFLAQRGELPDVPLLAAVPASFRTREEANTYGNLASAMTVRLPTNIEDPVQRLMAVKADADIAKADFALADGGRTEDILGLIPPVAHKVILRAVKRLMGGGRPLMGNVCVSNVPGPRAPLYFGDMKVAAIYGVGPLMPALALNITAWSYVDELTVSVLSDASTIPDLWPLTELLRDAFDELLKEATHRGAGGIGG